MKKLFLSGLVSCWLLLAINSLQAQVKILTVDAPETNPSIELVHSAHIIAYDNNIPSKHRLILMIVGTGGYASGSRAMDSVFAAMGYHVISLDYENNVITTVCSQSEDSSCFDRYRQEIITGDQVSEKVEVNKNNSLLNRFNYLLRYLIKHDPDGKWSEFYAGDEPAWNKIIAAGHSQGAGHAGYLGKMFRLSRVLMFSGPQDYLDDLHKPGAWLSKKSATPPSRFFAFLHLKDPFNVHHQIANDMKLMNLSRIDTLMVEPGVPVRGQAHILVNDIPTDNPHGSTISLQFANVWKYMLNEDTGKD
ncbi:MAG: hypothetical protein M3Z56_07750 [Bacteroidota bacterium]|nr:hypothetical protein [Bacteroidota bacterium]